MCKSIFKKLSLSGVTRRILHRAFVVILLFGSVVVSVSNAQERSWLLDGTIRDLRGQAISSASVVTDLRGIGAVADERGAFLLSGFGERPQRLAISHLGFKPVVVLLVEEDFFRELSIVLPDALLSEQGVTAFADRARIGETPLAFTDITADQIQRDYTVGDLPLALRSAPNVYTYTDAGSELGYSHLSLRGFDEKRISVYINGIPLNDPEDHVTYFVDLPDFSSNVRDIQIQRGVGSGWYGDGALGGSINIVSYSLDQPRRFHFSTGIGEYWDRSTKTWIGQTTRQNIEFSSGLIEGKYHVLTRYSRQSTGGYVENSWAKGWSYFLSGSRLGARSSVTFNTYGGPIVTHAAWDGIDRDTYNLNRRANFLTYVDEGDNFNQPHYELHHTYRLNKKTALHNTLYYIRGTGYYGQFKKGRDPLEFNIDTALVTDTLNGSVDVTIQQWVKKNQLGWNTRLSHVHDRGRRSMGFAGYYFDSEHWGQVNGALNVSSGFVPGQRYYEYFGQKWNLAVFAEEKYSLTENITAQLSIQLRHLRYTFRQTPLGAYPAGPNNYFSINWTFLSPRAGINFVVNEHNSIFASFAIASRAPRDQDIYDANDPSETPDLEVASERVYDFELGYQFKSKTLIAAVNLFYMLFDNEVIFYGVDDDGSRLTDNAKRSHHSGIELSATIHPHRTTSIQTNLSLNRNRYDDYLANTAVYDASSTRGLRFDENIIPGFPELLGSLTADYQTDRLRFTYRFRGAGKQHVESANLDSLAIAGFGVSGFTAKTLLVDSEELGKISLSISVENIFDHHYIQSGYGGNYLLNSQPNQTLGWAAYYASSGRSFFVLLNMDMN